MSQVGNREGRGEGSRVAVEGVSQVGNRVGREEGRRVGREEGSRVAV